MRKHTKTFLLGTLPALLTAQTISLQDAVRSALANHPGIQIAEAQTKIDRGAVQAAAGQFDSHVGAALVRGASQPLATGFNSSAQLPDANPSNYGINFSKQFRSGITASQAMSAIRAGDTQAQIAFTLSVPLMRGRGRAAVAAQEIAAGINYEAGLLDLSHAGSEAVRNVSIAYWNTLAAVRTLEVARTSEARAGKLVEDTRMLVDADRVPRADLQLLLANLKDKTAARISAEQAVMEQKQQLGLAMGLATADIEAAPSPSDAFPEPTGVSALPAGLRHYIELALGRRADLLALRKRQEAARSLVTGAKNAVLPQVNLSFNAGYAGTSAQVSSLLPMANGLPGLTGRNATVNLVYDFSPRNQVAQGLLAQAEAQYRQQALRTDDNARTIASGVVAAWSALAASAAELAKTREAVQHHEAAVNGENEKFRNQLASLIDVVIAEDRLNAALANQIAAHARYATAVSQFRFATGTFLSPGREWQTIGILELTTPPGEQQ